MSKLIAKNILLLIKEKKGIQAREIQLNKDYDTWKFNADQKSITINTDTPEIEMAEKATLVTPERGIDQNGDTSVTSLVNTSVDQISQLTKRVNDQKGYSSVTDLVNSSIDQKGYKERQKTILKTNSSIGQSVFNFYENNRSNETKEYITSYDGNTSVTNSANGQFGDSHLFRDDQNGDKEIKKIKHINKTINKTGSMFLFPLNLNEKKENKSPPDIISKPGQHCIMDNLGYMTADRTEQIWVP